MSTVFVAKSIKHFRATTIFSLLLLLWCQEAQAQLERKWLDKGSFHHWFSEAGYEPFMSGLPGTQWPGIVRNTDANRAKQLWIGAKNVTDEDGNNYPVRVAQIGPLNFGFGSMFPQELILKSRFEPSTVIVDGFESFDKPVHVDEVDPTLEADRMIHNVVNSLLGITVERKVLQFSQEYHDNYHIYDYTFTNTGMTGADQEVTMPDQVLEDVILHFFNRHGWRQISGFVSGAAWGRANMNDYVLDGNFAEHFGPEVRGYFSWPGYSPYFSRWNSIGGPLLDDSYSWIPEADSVGRLGTPQFVGEIVLHADTSPTDRSDDPAQPSTLDLKADEDWPEFGADRYNVPVMLQEYEYMTSGRTESHADRVEPPQEGVSWRERFANQTNNPDLGSPGGWGTARSYGPYTLEPGESVRIVFAEAAAGLDAKAALEIGKAYKAAWLAGNEDAPIEYEVNGEIHSMSKNEWVMTARDSLFQAYKRILANYASGYSLPQAPLPPSEFRITSGTDQILLEWETHAEARPEGFEIWRVTGRFDDLANYERVAELPSDARRYVDEQVVRGIGYYYYIQAIGNPADNNGAALTPAGVALKSSRYYSQSYSPAFLKRTPGSTLRDARIVPNPYNLASSQDIRWPDDRDRLGFLDIPGNATIKIFTELGELIQTVEHSDGSGDAYWNLTTSSNQVVATGIYIAVITDNDTGDRIIKKFTIIR